MSRSFAYGDKNFPDFNEALQRMCCRFLGREIDFGPAMSLGVVEDGKILGVVVFHDYIQERGTIEMTIGAENPKWLNRNVIKEIARLGFVMNGCQMMFARCDADYQVTSRILSKLGFQKVILPNMRGKGKDEALFHMTHDAWKVSRFSL